MPPGWSLFVMRSSVSFDLRPKLLHTRVMALSLDPVLLEVLACPAEHHAPLQTGTPDDPDAPFLTCTECGRMFPVRDGIPVLLLDDAVLPGDALGAAPAEGRSAAVGSQDESSGPGEA